MGHDLSKLEHQLETLNRRVTELSSIGLSKEMLLIHPSAWLDYPCRILPGSERGGVIDSQYRGPNPTIQATTRSCQASKDNGSRRKRRIIDTLKELSWACRVR